ncbi:MAG: MmcQ/YjbR family DNA-binding protein [Clostridia bacterium]|nr:MmcQ/YjbR family DNA-binding protein [Clostridia bacterium]
MAVHENSGTSENHGVPPKGEESIRRQVIDWIREKYHCGIEYLWMRFPSYGIFRHPDNRKWFALLMDVPRCKLGLSGEGAADVLNVKLGDPLLRDLLIRREGILPGYHISRGSWISILLDGTVPLAEVCSLVDASYQATASAATRKATRPPKEWLIPSNLKYFDSVHAFDHTDEIAWKQGAGIRTGDIVFMYIGAPVSAVCYKCVVTRTDIPWQGDQGALNIRSLMRIRLMKRYDPTQFTLSVLTRDHGVCAVRGPRGVPRSLSEALA